ncbi:hypothetical protein [Microbacterium atlanticum]|uniref:hypothetical protein n=1 Tax=Microbacterium atlanticum TaxID=2782168 RepID=UPI0018895FBE|nr:hypothetical protein [Microbacterium atlanticum]
MTDATLPPQEPGPEPDTTTAAESEHPDDSIESEASPAMLDRDDDAVDDFEI